MPWGYRSEQILTLCHRVIEVNKTDKSRGSGSSHCREAGDKHGRKGKRGAGEKVIGALGDMEQVSAPGDPGARVVGVGVFGKVALEQRPEGSEGASPVETGDRLRERQGQAAEGAAKRW